MTSRWNRYAMKAFGWIVLFPIAIVLILFGLGLLLDHRPIVVPD
jgi:hypothetical protein